jgi:hypothetical protein
MSLILSRELRDWAAFAVALALAIDRLLVSWRRRRSGNGTPPLGS